MTDVRDALGNPLVIGTVYGFSRNAQGITDIVIGEAQRVTPKGRVTLVVANRARAVYDEPPRAWAITQKTTSVYASALFPCGSRPAWAESSIQNKGEHSE